MAKLSAIKNNKRINLIDFIKEKLKKIIMDKKLAQKKDLKLNKNYQLTKKCQNQGKKQMSNNWQTSWCF